MNKLNARKACLNCSTVLEGDYCYKCSQASATGRMSFSRLFAKDIFASVFNLNRGFFKSCIDLIVRPGTLVKNYLSGQRKSYFHFAGLLFILLAIDALLLSVATNSELTLLASRVPSELEKSNFISLKGLERMYDFYKFTLAFITPLLALVPYFLLRKLRYFYAEHIVIAWFYLALTSLVSISSRLVGILPLSIELYQGILLAFGVVILALSVRFYWQVSVCAEYTGWSRTLRVIISSLISMLIYSAAPAYLTSAFSN